MKLLELFLNDNFWIEKLKNRLEDKIDDLLKDLEKWINEQIVLMKKEHYVSNKRNTNFSF